VKSLQKQYKTGKAKTIGMHQILIRCGEVWAVYEYKQKDAIKNE